MRNMKYIVVGDFALLGVAIIAFALSLFLAADGAGDAFVAIQGQKEAWYYPVESAKTIGVTGPVGETVVKVENGEARIVSSPCANQTCVTMGAIRGRGQWLACLPNAVLGTIEGKQKNESDAGTW
jgi:hypothetical protein